MNSWAAGRPWARIVLIGIHCDAANVSAYLQARICILVCVPRHRGHVIVGSTAFVVAKKEDCVFPRRTIHKSINDSRYLLLPFNDVVTWMFIRTIPIPWFDIRKLRQSPVLNIAEVLS